MYKFSKKTEPNNDEIPVVWETEISEDGVFRIIANGIYIISFFPSDGALLRSEVSKDDRIKCGLPFDENCMVEIYGFNYFGRKIRN